MARQTPPSAQPVTPATPDALRTVLVGDFGTRAARELFHELPDTGLSITCVADRLHLVSAVLAARPVAVLLPISDQHGLPSAPLVSRLATEAPDVPVIVLWNPERDRALLAEAIRSGAELAAVRSSSELLACLRRLGRLGTLSAADTDAVRSLLADASPPLMVDILLAAVRSAHQGLAVDDLVSLVGVSRRTLYRQLTDARWPAPEELIDWARLLRASLVQWREASSLVALAHASGFSGAQPLRRTAARLLGSDAELPGALAPLGVSTAFRRRLAALARG